MPSSSRSSRARAASSDSPGATLPPGNSQRPAMCFPAGRSAMSTLPEESSSAAATTRITPTAQPQGLCTAAAGGGGNGQKPRFLAGATRGQAGCPDPASQAISLDTRQGTVAMLVLLAGSAGTGLVAADLALPTHEGPLRVRRRVQSGKRLGAADPTRAAAHHRRARGGLGPGVLRHLLASRQGGHRLGVLRLQRPPPPAAPLLLLAV